MTNQLPDNTIKTVYVESFRGNTINCLLYDESDFTKEPQTVRVSVPDGLTVQCGWGHTRTVKRKFLGLIPYNKKQYLTPPYREGNRLFVVNYYDACKRCEYTDLNSAGRHWSDNDDSPADSTDTWIAKRRAAKKAAEAVGYVVKNAPVEGACVKASSSGPATEAVSVRFTACGDGSKPVMLADDQPVKVCVDGEVKDVTLHAVLASCCSSAIINDTASAPVNPSE